MSNVSQWSTTAASNNSAVPDGSPEGMSPAGVNNSVREVMAAVMRVYDDSRGALTSGGSGNAYTLSTNNGASALTDLPVLAFQVDRTNTADNPTLNVDGLGTKQMQRNGVNLKSGELRASTVVLAAYDATADAFSVFGAQSVSSTTLETTTSAPTATAGEGSLYVKEFEGNTELFWQDEDGNEVRLTFNGELAMDLKNTDVIVGSIRTLSFSRGNVVTVTPQTGAAPSGRDLVQIDWSEGTVFRVTLVADSDLEFLNMPDTSVDEEQTIYVDMQDGGNFFIGLISDFTLLWPAGRAGNEELTTDGRDLFLATTDDGVSVMVVPMLDMSESS